MKASEGDRVSDVSCVVSAPIIEEVRARGLDPAPLVDGLDLDLSLLEDRRRRVPWPAFVEFAGRANDVLGAETIEDLAAEATVEFVPTPIRRVLPRLTDSRPLFMLAPRWWGPWVFRGTRGSCERMPDGRLREVVKILPDYAACPELLQGLRGTLRAMPRLLDQPDALVTLEHDGREGEFLITPPPRRRRAWPAWLARRARRTRKETSLAERELEELGFAREQLVARQRSVETLSLRLGEESRRLSLLQHLGITLAEHGDISAGALEQEIVDLLQRKADVTGVRLTSRSGPGEPPRRSIAGSLSGAAREKLPLLSGGREIGVLEVWRSGETPRVRLDPIVPWIAIALEYGGARATADHLTRLLRQDVSDWARMERRVDRVLQKLGVSRADEPFGADADPIGESSELVPFLAGLAPRLSEVAGEDVGLELDFPERLRATLFDEQMLRSLLLDVVHILGDVGSRRIRIETRARIEPSGRSAAALAEIRIEGTGGQLDATARSRVRAAAHLGDAHASLAGVDFRFEEDGAVGVSVRLPMPTTEPGRLRH